MSDKTTFESKGSQVIARHGCKTISMSVQEANKALDELRITINTAERFQPLISDLLLELNMLFRIQFDNKSRPKKKSSENFDIEKAAVEYLMEYKNDFVSMANIVGKISEHLDTEKYIKIFKEVEEDKLKKEIQTETRYQTAVKELHLLKKVFSELNIDYEIEYSEQPEDIEESIDTNVENHYSALNRFAKVKHKIKRRTLLSGKLRKLIKEYSN